MTKTERALLCGACGWLIAGMRPEDAAAVPRCLACGAEGLHSEPVEEGVRMARAGGEPARPGWAIYSRPTLDKNLPLLESLN